MSEYDLPIMSSTKVGALLDRYPELEDVLIGIAPPFAKLRNPILRKSVAKVASLQQAAAVARMPAHELVNALRAAVGQEAIESKEVEATASYFSSQPGWFDGTKIVVTIDERVAGDKDRMPLVTVLREANRMGEAEIVELVTTFLPAPGIDIMKRKGFNVWSVQEEPELIRTYFSRPVLP